MSDQIIGFGWLSLTSINSGSESGAYGNIDKNARIPLTRAVSPAKRQGPLRGKSSQLLGIRP
jgi:hypothetical protein